MIIETVGVGQDEVEIAKASDTTVVVSAPGLGDEIQAIKAGVLEIADIHVVSKCDRSDANRTMVDLKQMLTLGAITADAGGVARSPWWASVRSAAKASTSCSRPSAGTATWRWSRRWAGGGGRALPGSACRRPPRTCCCSASTAPAADLAPALAERLLAREADPYSLASELVLTSLKKEFADEQA